MTAQKQELQPVFSLTIAVLLSPSVDLSRTLSMFKLSINHESSLKRKA